MDSKTWYEGPCSSIDKIGVSRTADAEYLAATLRVVVIGGTQLQKT